MSTTYKVITGDTFSIISRKVYGTETNAGRISTANPGVIEPLTPGTTITVPALPAAPKNVTQTADASDEDEVSLLIEGTRFRFWSQVKITKSIDSIDSVEFSAPFDADSPDARESFRPFSYKSVDVDIGGSSFFKGNMVA